jgi:asparagine synthase (glutamine-hydrolysing)
MCGIAAIISRAGRLGSDAFAIRRMTDAQRHRGPDDAGTFADSSVALGSRRLAIVDLSSASRQPFRSDDGRHVLVFNGEIYNFIELRHELESLGHGFRTTGDTEVLLHAYREWGAECLPKLNGMFAFLIYDKGRGSVFGARDRFGVKPLFRVRTPRELLFASEIKAFRASGLVTLTPNEQAVCRFLQCGTLDQTPLGNDTFYEGVEQVPPGSAFEIHLDGRERQWRYWSLVDQPPVPVDKPAERFAALFDDAMRLRMRSDVRAGVPLSGGLDSTSIICTMAAVKPAGAARIDAFAYESSAFDESPYIRATTAQTNAVLHRIPMTGMAVWDALPRVLWFHDEPIHSATAVVGYEVFRHVADAGIKVVLSGQGADETLAGYDSYFASSWLSLVADARFASAWRNMDEYSGAHGGRVLPRFLNTVERAAKRGLRRLSPYRDLVQRQRARESARDAHWFTVDVRSAASGSWMTGGGQPLGPELLASTTVAPLPLYLRIEDRNSMAHSVEARLPFLDHRLVSFAFQLPDDWKIRGAWNKYVLREAMKGRIPESVRTRSDKMGFPTPVDDWFRNELYGPTQDLLASQATRERGLVRVDLVRADLERHRRGEVQIGAKLFSVVQMEQWLSGIGQPLAEEVRPAMDSAVASIG